MVTQLPIRYATFQDAEPLNQLAAQTMRETFGPPHNPADIVEAYVTETFTTEQMQAELTDPKATFLVVDGPDGQLVGYAKLRQIRPPRQLKGQHAIEVQRLYISNQQIGTGLGRQLLERCLAEARNRGYATVWLGVWERNLRAIGFYERMGFQRCGWHYFPFGGERQRDYWMKKDL